MFGQADFMASVGIRSLDVGGQPEGYAGGDAYHYALMRILIAARFAWPAGHRRAVPEGPRRGRLRAARPASAAALGYDGKWVLHPGQVEAANQAFAPPGGDYSAPWPSSRLTPTPPGERAAPSCSATR